MTFWTRADYSFLEVTEFDDNMDITAFKETKKLSI